MRIKNQSSFAFIQKMNSNRNMVRSWPLMLLFFLFMSLLSCNKENNEIVNKIKGKWKLEKRVDSQGETVTSGDDQETYMSFDKCILKENKKNYCNGSIYVHVEGTPVEFPFEYRVEDDGKTLIQKSTATPSEITETKIEFEGDDHLIVYENVITIGGEEENTLTTHYVRVE